MIARLIALSGFALAPALLGGCSLPSNETGAALTRTGQLVAMSGGDGGARNACFSCHGLEGEGDGIAVPRLAGMDAGYLQKQMEDYASDRRHDATMTPIATRLDPRQRRAVARFYADLPAPAGPASASPPPSPPRPGLWLTGDATRGIVACATCHGVGGEGVGPGNPALAGQPAAYLVDQITRWRKAERRNDPRNVMTMAVAGLTATEATAIARWLERQSASPAPDTDVASASAAATAAARPAPLHEARRRGR
ncbi:MAG: cytochrome [Brevundimonas sp.]|nr:cytochrome [Brevundimonas sp.]